jgi:NDP-sugar pyrophosphorylase family protein
MDLLGLDEVLVANGDTYLKGNVAAMLAPLDRAGGELFRMAVVTVANRSRFGGVQYDDDGRIQRFMEKGQQGAGAINAGMYRLCRAALPAARPGAYSLEAEILPSLVALGAVTVLPVDGSFIDIGVPDDYFRFCEEHAV